LNAQVLVITEAERVGIHLATARTTYPSSKLLLDWNYTFRSKRASAYARWIWWWSVPCLRSPRDDRRSSCAAGSRGIAIPCVSGG